MSAELCDQHAVITRFGTRHESAELKGSNEPLVPAVATSTAAHKQALLVQIAATIAFSRLAFPGPP